MSIVNQLEAEPNQDHIEITNFECNYCVPISWLEEIRGFSLLHRTHCTHFGHVAAAHNTRTDECRWEVPANTFWQELNQLGPKRSRRDNKHEPNGPARPLSMAHILRVCSEYLFFLLLHSLFFLCLLGQIRLLTLCYVLQLTAKTHGQANCRAGHLAGDRRVFDYFFLVVSWKTRA